MKILSAFFRKIGLILLFVVFPGTLVLSVTICSVDAYVFYKTVNGHYKTPWYSPDWWDAPYTNARLSLMPSTEYWTTNAMGSEKWLVRETKVGDVVFWTTLRRVPMQHYQ